jgi:DNA repair protein RadC
MEHVLFERPREKLHLRGVSFLTTVELIQVILGSGSAHASSARLAKRVANKLTSNETSLDQLMFIPGIGMAKACQILASIELGGRIYHRKADTKGVRITAERLQKSVSNYRQTVMNIYFFDGAGNELGDKVYQLKQRAPGSIVQAIAVDALSYKTRSIDAVLGSKNDGGQTTITELDLIKRLKESMDLLNIKLTTIYRSNENKTERWHDA